MCDSSWIPEMVGGVAESLLEKVAPTSSNKRLSKAIKSEELAFNLQLSGLVYTPATVIVFGAVFFEAYCWSFSAFIAMIVFVVWCALYAKSEQRYQKRKGKNGKLKEKSEG